MEPRETNKAAEGRRTLQDAGALSERTRTARSVLACARPRALFLRMANPPKICRSL